MFLYCRYYLTVQILDDVFCIRKNTCHGAVYKVKGGLLVLSRIIESMGGGGGVLTPKKPKKNQKKPSQFTNFGVATGFFGFFWVCLVFLVFFWFFWFFLVFFWYFLG